MTMAIRPYSTKTFRKPAPEFEPIFVQHGWAKVNRMFGKRCSQRWYIMLGAERLKAARARYVRGNGALAVNVQVEIENGV